MTEKLTKIIVVSILLFLMLPLIVPAEVDGRVFDDGNLFTSSEKLSLENIIQTAEKETGLFIAVMTTDDVGINKSDHAVVSYADDYYDKIFGINTNGILFMINNDSANKYDYITTSGKAIEIFDDKFINDFFNYIHKYLINEDFYEASCIFVNSITDYANADNASNNKEYRSTDKNEYYISKRNMTVNKRLANFLFAGLIISLITVVSVIFVVKKRYKIHPVISSKNYLNHSSIRYHQRSDVFLRQYVTKTRIKSDDKGGGGGSFHRSSGGGYHGGGGRHR